MFQVSKGANTKSGFIIDLVNAVRGGRHLKIYPKGDSEQAFASVLEGLKHYYGYGAHDVKICALCQSEKEALCN